jgi:exonuclease V
MASPAIEETIAIADSIQDNDSDYGSDFSPEEAQIVERLLSGKPLEAIEDNPIINTPEQYDAKEALRLPRIAGREQRSPFFKAVRDAERVAEQISFSVANRQHYPHCKNPLLHSAIILTDAEASSEKSDSRPSARSNACSRSI